MPSGKTLGKRVSSMTMKTMFGYFRLLLEEGDVARLADATPSKRLVPASAPAATVAAVPFSMSRRVIW